MQLSDGRVGPGICDNCGLERDDRLKWIIRLIGESGDGEGRSVSLCRACGSTVESIWSRVERKVTPWTPRVVVDISTLDSLPLQVQRMNKRDLRAFIRDRRIAAASSH